MLTIATLHRDQSAASDNGVFGSLITAIERLLVRQRFNPEADGMKEEAIAILCDFASTVDLRDWAERYLCGMTSSDAATYLERRPCQS
jgi:hypothetical protein